MKPSTSLLLALLLSASGSFAQVAPTDPGSLTTTQTQTIRGRVLDAESHYPVFSASVAVQGSVPPITSTTDEEGRFTLKNVPLGRNVIVIAAFGYAPMTTSPLVLVSGKELVMDLDLQPSVSELKEVEVKANGADKERLNNEMAVMSARTFDSELAARFAGSRNDPARMATNFAGVSGANDGRNDIIIRGNSPNGLLWRMEGIDIPSPNHFSSFGSTGGPVSMLNNNVLAKSDFITSAFPAMYGNALSGVFDLTLRNGNDEKHEFLGQIGFNGFELGAEGPINKASHSSYLVNYRYSTLGAFKTLGLNFGTGSAVPQYQDLSFKVNLPTQKAGVFALFGFGGKSNIELLGSGTDFSKANDNELYGNESQDIHNKSHSGMVGLSHVYFFNERVSTKLTIAASEQKDDTDVDSLTWSTGEPTSIRLLGSDPVFGTHNRLNALNAHVVLRDKINARNTVNVGVVMNQYDVSFFKRVLRKQQTSTLWDTLQTGTGNFALLQAYATWKHHFSEKLLGTLGVHGQYHDLSKASSVEPRAGISYKANDHTTLSAAYGLHAQTQGPTTYFTTTPDGRPTSNRQLGSTRSHHGVLGLQQRLGTLWSLKMETYYQWVFDVPVERVASNFSVLNSGADFNTPNEDGLVNTGVGRNYGAEFTVERTFDKGFYGLFTASLFKSEYQGSDAIWHSTVFDGNYVFNALSGREWKLGKRNNSLAVDLKATWAGGRRYTPIDLQTSLATGQETLFEDQAFTAKYPDYFRADVKLMFRMQRKKVTHEMGIDLQNISGNKNIFARNFDERTQKIVTEYQIGFFPIPQYRILF
jgi:Carboxypeptidase regulatory-like domain